MWKWPVVATMSAQPIYWDRYTEERKKVQHTTAGMLRKFAANTYDDWRVLDRHDAWHGVDNPLRTDDDTRLQKLILEMLNGAQIMQELNSLSNLHAKWHDRTQKLNNHHTILITHIPTRLWRSAKFKQLEEWHSEECKLKPTLTFNLLTSIPQIKWLTRNCHVLSICQVWWSSYR